MSKVVKFVLEFIIAMGIALSAAFIIKFAAETF